MRNALVISSILFIAVGCKRREESAPERQPATGQETTTAPSGTSGGTTAPGTGETGTPGTTGGTAGTPSGTEGGAAGTPSGTTGGATGTPSSGGQQGATGGQQGAAGGQQGAAGGQQGAAGGQQGAADGQQGAAGGQQGASGQMASISCDQIVTQNTRDKYLANGTVRDMSKSGGAGMGGQQAQTQSTKITMCQVESPNLQQPVEIQAICGSSMQGAMAQSAADLKQQHPNAQEVPNVGKAAVLDKSGNTQTLSAIDDDSNCRLDVQAPNNVDAVALGRELLNNMPGRG